MSITESSASAWPAKLLVDMAGELETARQRWATPAIAVCLASASGVVDSAVFGLADLDGARAATPHTRFAVASVSKSFAALSALMLVQQGKLHFDTPLRELMPELQLASAEAERGLTLRDLLCHRSGLPRHDFLWYGSALSRQALFDKLRHLQPSLPLRGGWQYQNALYMTLSLVIERASGVPWEDFVRRHIFSPLGMSRANFSIAELLADADHALPYRMDREGQAVLEQYVPVDAIGGAGSINMSLNDLSAWVALLARGGSPLVPPAAFAELQQAEVRVPLPPLWPELADTHYGMGYFVTHYRGHKLVHHGGNLTGASAMTAFLPGHGLALGILTNVSRGSVRDWLMVRLLDRALGLPPIDWEDRFWALRQQALKSEQAGEALVARALVAARAAEPAPGPETEPGAASASAHAPSSSPLAGEYLHPGYGSAQVWAAEGALRLRYNGFETVLRPAGRDCHDTPDWEFTLGKTKARFLYNLFGDLTGLELHVEHSLPGAVFTRVWPGADDTQRLEGLYSLPGQRAQVLRVGDKLTWQVLGLTPRLTLMPLGGARYALEGAVETVVQFTHFEGQAGVLLQTRGAASFGARQT